jgi:hypothetical protein
VSLASNTVYFSGNTASLADTAEVEKENNEERRKKRKIDMRKIIF